MITDNILLLTLGFVSVCSAVAVVQAATPVKSVLSLILVFISFFGFALLLGAEFLAMAYAIVYMGAIAILFLFVVMMLEVRTVVGEFYTSSVIGVILGCMGISALLWSIDHSGYRVFAKYWSAADNEHSFQSYPFGVGSAPTFPTRDWTVLLSEIGNTEAIGWELIYAFDWALLLCALVLLVGMVGITVICGKRALDESF